MDCQLGILFGLFVNFRFDYRALVLLLDLLDLHELIVSHFICIFEDPLSDFFRVDFLALLADLGCISSFLLVKLGSFLHGDNFLVLTLRLDVCLRFLTLHLIKFSLLLLNFAFHISFFFGSLLQKLSLVVALFLNPLHHRDLLRFHLLDLGLHRFRLKFLLVQGLRQLRLLTLLLLELF